MRHILLIALGGGTGAVLRYWIQGWSQALAPGVFPVGTLVVNLLGCFAIGLLGAALSGPVLVRPELRFALLVGLLGGFTTFSTYGWESFALMNDGEAGLAMLNLLLSNVLGLAGVWLGYRIAEVWYGV